MTCEVPSIFLIYLSSSEILQCIRNLSWNSVPEPLCEHTEWEMFSTTQHSARPTSLILDHQLMYHHTWLIIHYSLYHEGVPLWHWYSWRTRLTSTWYMFTNLHTCHIKSPSKASMSIMTYPPRFLYLLAIFSCNLHWKYINTYIENPDHSLYITFI